jgi:VWFA-related protein
LSPARALLTSLIVLPSLLLAAQEVPDPGATAQTPPAQSSSAPPISNDQITTLHATARLVVLDVVVTDGNGHPAKGLKPSDFALTEDGVPQTLLSFTEHDSPSEAAPPAPAPDLPPNTFTTQAPIAAEGAKTVIVLGDPTELDPRSDTPEFPNGSGADSPFVRDQLKAYFDSAAPNMPIAIVRLDWQGLHVVQGLTMDRKVLLDATASKRMLPPLGFPVRYARIVGSPLQYLAGYLASIPGRINLVWFAAGASTGGRDGGLFPDASSGVPPDLAAFVRTLGGGAPNVHRISRIALYIILAGGLQAQAPCLDQGCVEQIAYAASAGMAGCMDAMNIAISAGGRAYCDNGFKEDLAEVSAIGSHYYTVSYRPTNERWNGAFRSIKVKVGPDKPFSNQLIDWLLSGWQIPRAFYRDGYYARDTPEPTPSPPVANTTAPQTAEARKLISYSPKGDPTPFWGGRMSAMQTAMAFGSLAPDKVNFTIVATPSQQAEAPRPGDPLPKGSFLTEPFRGVPYRNYRIHYWIAPKDLQLVRTPSGSYREDLQFVAMVYRDDGLVANSLSTNAHIQIPADDPDNILTLGATFDQTIALPVTGNPLPGSFFLRVGVHELATDRIGAIEVPAEWVKLPPVGDPVAATH